MSPNSRQRRHGFTLVELLVVIVIIGILVAIFFQFLETARTPARRHTCMNNVRQIVLAAQSYASGRLRLPPGSGTNGESVFVKLLNEMEQKPLADQYRKSIQDAANEEARYNIMASLSSNRLDFLLCANAPGIDAGTTALPTAPPMPDITNGFGDFTSHYRAITGPTDVLATNTYGSATGFTLSAPGGLIGRRGMFSPNAKFQYRTKEGIKSSDISDGLSNTLAFGECSRSDDTGNGPRNFTAQRPGWAFGHYDSENNQNAGDAYTNRTVDVTFNAVSISTGLNLNGGTQTFNNHNLGSNHPGGAVFARGDGSTVFLDEETEALILQQAAAIDDGQWPPLDL